ncbi:hypothetical protein ACRAWF_14870 [Streptomyces sp. L7]
MTSRTRPSRGPDRATSSRVGRLGRDRTPADGRLLLRRRRPALRHTYAVGQRQYAHGVVVLRTARRTDPARQGHREGAAHGHRGSEHPLGPGPAARREPPRLLPRQRHDHPDHREDGPEDRAGHGLRVPPPRRGGLLGIALSRTTPRTT